MRSLWVGAAVLLVFSPALGSDFLRLWDDQLYVLNNPLIRFWSVSNLVGIFTTTSVGNYAPVQILSYALDYSLWGLNPVGYHLTNLLLHAVNASLLYSFLRRLEVGPRTALVAALIFGLHAAQVESAVWVSQRKNVFAMTFSLMSLLLYVRRRERGGRFPGVASVLSFGLAVLSKSVAIGIPVLLFALDRCVLDRRWGRARFAAYLPYVVLAVGAAIVTVRAQMGGGIVPYYGGSPWSTALTMAGTVLDYARIILFPTNLAGVYKPEIIGTLSNARALFGAVLVAGFIVLAVWAHRTGKKRVFFWCLWIVVTFLPVAQIIPINAVMADRYLYFPLVGVSVLAASALRLDSGRRVPALISAVMVTAFAALTLARIPIWKNDFVFWQDNAHKASTDPQSHLNYGYLLEQRGDAAGAIRQYTAALQWDDSYFLAHNALAWVYLTAADPRLRDLPRALDHAGRAMELSRGAFPEIVDTWIATLEASGRREDAKHVLQDALRRFPGNSLFIDRLAPTPPS